MYKKIFVLLAAAMVLAAGCTGSPKTKEESFTAGMQQLADKNAGAAIVYFKNALEKDQNFFDARFQLARAYSVMGKYEASEKELTKVMLQRPGAPEVVRELARTFALGGKPDEALKTLARLGGSAGHEAEVLEISGWALALKGDYETAAGRLQKAADGQPGRTTGLTMLARVYLLQGKPKAARVEISKVLQAEPSNRDALYLLADIQARENDTAAALATYDGIIAKTPGDSSAYFLKGMLLVALKRYEEALKLSETLRENFPGSHQGYELRGMAYFNRKNYKDAINALQKAVTLRADANICYFLGLSHFYIQEPEQAMNQMQRSLAMNPGLSQPRVIIALIYLKKNKIDDAIAEITKVLAVQDRNATVHSILGSAYLAKGMYGEGIAELNRALELDPSLVEARVRKGMFELSRGRAAEAETELSAAVEADPDLVSTRVLLAAYYLKRDESGKALATAEQGLRGQKADALLLNLMADARMQQNRTEDAMQTLQRAKEADPGYSATYFKTAVLHQLAGEQEKALALLKGFADSAPENMQAQLGAAAQFEFAGNDRQARFFFERARKTGSVDGTLEAVRYYLRRREPDRALAVLDDGIRKNPSNADFYELKGRANLELQRPEEAIKAYEELAKREPAAGFSGMIDAYFAANNPDRALERVRREMKGKPGRAALQASVSRIYVKMGKYREAADQAREIIRSEPGRALGYITLAMVHESAGHPDQAIEALNSAVSVPDARISLMLGNLHAARKNYPAALAAFEKAEAQPGGATSALFQRALILHAMGSRNQAIAAYRRLLKLSPGHVRALNNLAYLYLQEKESLPRALQYAVQALMLAPTDGAVQDTLGFALLKNGRVNEALQALKRAASALPDDPSINFHLALALTENRDRARALIHLEKALASEDFPEITMAKNLLVRLNGEGAGIR